MATLNDRFYAEFIGTFVLTFFGIAPIAKNTLEDSIDGDLWVAFGWWFSVMLGIIISDKISGAHLNPAVSLAFYISSFLKGIPANAFTLVELVTYSASQLLGAYTAAALLYIVYFHHFQEQNCGKTLETAAIFVTFPNDALHHNWQGLVTESVGTAILVIVIFCYIEKVHKFSGNTIMKGLVVGATVFSIIQSMTGIAGPSLNPARDFGPRLFILPIWGNAVLTGFENYFWIPIIGPLLGSICGTVLFHHVFKQTFDDLYFAQMRNENFDESLLKQLTDSAKIQNHLTAANGAKFVDPNAYIINS